MLLHPGRPHDGGKAVLGDGRRDALHGLLRQGLPPATARGLACADVWLPPTDDGRQRMIMTGTSPLFSGPLIQRQTTSAPAPAPCGFHAFHVCRGSLCVSMTLDAPCWVSLLPSFLRTRRCATIWRKDFPWSRRTKMRATVKRGGRTPSPWRPLRGSPGRLGGVQPHETVPQTRARDAPWHLVSRRGDALVHCEPARSLTMHKCVPTDQSACPLCPVQRRPCLTESHGGSLPCPLQAHVPQRAAAAAPRRRTSPCAKSESEPGAVTSGSFS